MRFADEVIAITDARIAQSGTEPAGPSYSGPLTDPHALKSLERHPLWGDWRAICSCGWDSVYEQTPQSARRHHLDHADGEYPLAMVLEPKPNESELPSHWCLNWFVVALVIEAALYGAFRLIGWVLR